jgi:hypothetical protein
LLTQEKQQLGEAHPGEAINPPCSICFKKLIFTFLIYVFGLWSLIFNLFITIRDIRAQIRDYSRV